MKIYDWSRFGIPLPFMESSLNGFTWQEMSWKNLYFSTTSPFVEQDKLFVMTSVIFFKMIPGVYGRNFLPF